MTLVKETTLGWDSCYHTSARLLIRLYMYHHANPPDEASAAAVKRLDKLFSGYKRPARTPVDRIIADLCEEHDVTREDLTGRSIHRGIAEIRTQGYLRCIAETDMSNKAIGEAFGRGGGTCTVMRAIATYERRQKKAAKRTKPLPEAG